MSAATENTTGPAAPPKTGAEDAPAAFPSLRRVGIVAAFAFAAGTATMTASLGLRTAGFLPDYSLDSVEMAFLATQGTAELAFGLLVGFIVTFVRRGGIAKGVLVGTAVAVCLFKVLAFTAFVTLTEPPDASISPGTYLVCMGVTLPLWISFFPVLSALAEARNKRAIDGPLKALSAVSAWFFSVSLGSLILGPDLAVRAIGLVALAGAGLSVWAGARAERRLAAWLSEAVRSGAPVYSVQPGPASDDVRSVYEGEKREALLVTSRQDSASYRREPMRSILATFDPERVSAPRSYRARLKRPAGVFLLVGALASALSWPFLHGADLPPRRLSSQYNHVKITRNEEYEIPGIVLWTVEMGLDNRRLVGFDSDQNRVIEGEALFRRARGVPTDTLAKLANSVLFDGRCCVLTGSEAPRYKDEKGETAKAPVVAGDKLLFYRRNGDVAQLFTVDIDPAMVSSGQGP